MTKIQVNGKEKEISPNSSIYDILKIMEIKTPMIVIEKNREIVTKDKYNTILEDGDNLEIAGFFGGG